MTETAVASRSGAESSDENPSRRQWALSSARTEYVVGLLPDGSGLVGEYWGERSGRAPEPWSEPQRMLSYSAPEDAVPLEYASDGQRHASFSEVLVDRGDSERGARWRVELNAIHYSTTTQGSELEVPFLDAAGELRLRLRYESSSEHDVIRRMVRIENVGSRDVRLRRAFSAAWNLPVGGRSRIEYLAGSWANEFGRRTVELRDGDFSIGSRQGVTSLSFSPVVSVTSIPDADSPAMPEDAAFGVALAWSGSWRLHAEALPVGQYLRVSTGVHEDSATILLEPGQQFDAPESLGVFSASGTAGVSRAWQHYQRSALARQIDDWHQPIVYNSWYATAFSVDEEHQLRLAQRAADIGAEVFVVDDGWFIGRDSDSAGLGDWSADPQKFPSGLAAFGERVRALGLRFGIWIEPECVNPDSELFRAHPDWIYRATDRAPIQIRNQYVLDIGREEVVSWIEETLRTLLRSAPISYVKWDMNRPITDGGRPGDRHGYEWTVQHTRNYYRVLRMLREEFPAVTVEACASGGGRLDNAVLGLSDVTWTSDEVGPWDRLRIQHGFLSAYPPHVMSSWVSDDAGHRDRMPVSLAFRFLVAMAGSLGIGSDLLQWDDGQRDEATQLVALYRRLRPTVHNGELTVHGEPSQPGYCLEFSLDGRTVLLVYDRDRDRNRDREQVRVFPTSLEADRSYRVAGTGAIVSGAIARSAGMVIPFTLAPDADVLIIDEMGGLAD